MQDLYLILALVGVVVLPVFAALWMESGKTREAKALVQEQAERHVAQHFVMPKRKATQKVAVL